VNIRFLDNLPVVSGVFPTADPKQLGGLTTGDVITEIADIPVAKLIKSWERYYAASNEEARFSHIGSFMTRGDCGEFEIGIRRESADKKPVELKLKVQRTTPANSGAGTATHDLPGPTFRLLSKDIAYLKLSSVKAGQATHYVEHSAGTKGLIIDIRNYPSSFMVFALGSLLAERETQFARFTSSDLSNPGAFHWTTPESLSPQQPHYFGKVVILVDETSMSQAEYTAMAFRSAPGAIVVGSTTAGADGNVSPFPLPGDLRTMISGLGVFYPDKTPTQRIGIVPNVVARPTIAGIRAGRDEVLEEALRQILGAGTSTAEIEKMAQPSDAVPQQ
jgi:C-terminal processing protease CtpA/Prc